MIYGYGIVDKDNQVYWADQCVCEDRGPMDETCETLNDEDDPRAPYRVIELQTLDAPPLSGALMIAAERQRQIEQEGWTPEHDDQHDDRELLYAAETYMFGDPDAWPWDEDSYKPKDKITDLIRAGALIAAEIDRLIRQDQPMDSISKER